MPAAWPWFERKFEFNFPVERYQDIVERVRGTPARVEELVRSIPEDVLTRRDGDTWSIQENVGHLLDLEPLWSGRVEDIMAGVETMRPADLTNKKTHEAGHNAEALERLLAGFRQARSALVARLDAMSPADFGRCGNHPRLKQPMRVVDLCFFVAEHDDYHLARITTLERRFRR
jgi:uncharacterized damage-inducible protein DinB